ncbi:MAG: glycosyltransferase [Chitinophagales bacterium]|nr:glycosyltransferase [Chitinophagales bacterium]MDW8273235.1 glycosyltransferase [Chitinophagales bacterium]
MKKVLILAYTYPPYVAVGGLRPFGWYNYLSDYGIYPVVVTRQWDNQYRNELDYVAPSRSANVEISEDERGTVIRAPYFPNLPNRLLLAYGPKRFRLLRKGLSLMHEILQWYVPFENKRTLYHAADAYLRRNKVSAIIATGDPFILFKYADELSRKHRVPWIADYRDLWSQDVNIFKNRLFIKWSRHIEKKIVSRADYIITVSEMLAQVLSEILPKPEKLVITNGYDNKLFDSLQLEQKQSDTLSIGCAGTIYEWHPLEVFIEAVENFLSKQNVKLSLNFIGISDTQRLEYVLEKCTRTKLITHIIPKVPNRELLERLAACNVLLLFNYYSFTGTKIYDYLALKRRILLCFKDDPQANELKKRYYYIPTKKRLPEDLQERIIQYTHSGDVAKDANHLQQLLSAYVSELQSSGIISCTSRHVEEFSRALQTKKLAEFIHSRYLFVRGICMKF